MKGNVRMLNQIRYRFIRISRKTRRLFSTKVYFGKNITRVPNGSIIFFPYSQNIFFCGLAGIIAFKSSNNKKSTVDISSLKDTIRTIQKHNHKKCVLKDSNLHPDYLGGQELIKNTLKTVQELKNEIPFYNIFSDKNKQEDIVNVLKQLNSLIESESKWLADTMGRMTPDAVDAMSCRIECLKDIAWCLDSEIINNTKKVKDLIYKQDEPPSSNQVTIIKNINAALNSLDRLEVRGRDSAGVSLIYILKDAEFDKFMERIQAKDLTRQLKSRSEHDFLMNLSVSIGRTKDESGTDLVSIAFVYKVAAEIGSLGDNVRFLRKQIK
jgi:glucosamine--fructose-6-phosphate aminotransferase (isomerizing)